jgi:hypothetical protein
MYKKPSTVAKKKTAPAAKKAELSTKYMVTTVSSAKSSTLWTELQTNKALAPGEMRATQKLNIKPAGHNFVKFTSINEAGVGVEIFVDISDLKDVVDEMETDCYDVSAEDETAW